MKNTCLFIMLAAVLGLASFPAAGEDASKELGEKLFNDPALGGSKNTESCGACHPGGEGLEGAGRLANLTEAINLCIERPLKGEKIGVDSVEMKSLVLYIKSLSN